MIRRSLLASAVIGVLLAPFAQALAGDRAQAVALQNAAQQNQERRESAKERRQEGATRRAEGYILHENTRTGEETLYRFRVMSDTTVRVRQGQGPSASSVILPRLVALTLSEQIEEAFPVDSAGRSDFEVEYENRALVIQLARRVDLLVLGGLGLLIFGLGGSAFVLWRRLAKERRRRAALDRARRHQAEGQEKERRRLAREIHDGPVQDLHGLHMQMAAAEGDGPVGEALMRVTKELRAVSADLRPPALEKFGLAAALRSFAGRFRERHPRLDVTLQLDKEGELAEQARLALFRVAQEAMNNAAQHAGEAGRLTVQLNQDGGAARLDVRDDGNGFEMPKDLEALAEEGHFGLLGMAERAEAAGGELDVDSAPGQGTRVTAWVPRPEAAQPTGLPQPSSEATS